MTQLAYEPESDLVAALQRLGEGHLPGQVGIEITAAEPGAGFTTAELKSNFLATATTGTLACRAWLVHGGRTTQVWDAEVTHEETGRVLALFRCTQVVLYPRERPGPRAA